jgi:hypothetical protein
MLRSMSSRQFYEWRAYAAVEPFDETRDDLRAASIARIIAEVNRNPKKRSKAFQIEDFMLSFDADDVSTQIARKQHWKEQKMYAQMLCAAYSE